ncbi:hypothetical protein BH23ACT4_BH23ACT4_04230 [soil metagenome]
MDTAKRSAPASTETVYDGFISYSHAADGLLAPRLQAGLQRFAKPWWKRRAVRVFRDESSLSANPHLWSSITEALDESAWFVLLLSPDAAASPWVNQEIEYWKDQRDSSRILPVLTDGTFEWTDSDVSGSAVPEQLVGVFSEEPRWVDLRFAQDEEQLDLKNPRFSAGVADIASALRGVPKDELESEEVKQHRRTVRTAWGAAALVGVLTIAAVVFGIQAASNASRAETEAARATQEADRAEAEAERAEANATEAAANAQLAQARELAASGVNVVAEDPELSVLLALEAIDATPEGIGQPAEVIDALWTAGTNHRLVGILDPGSGHSARIDLSPDGSKLAVANIGGALLRVYDAETLDPLWEYGEVTPDNFSRVRFSPNGELLSLSIVDSDAASAGPVDTDLFPELEGVSAGDEEPARVHVFDSSTGELLQTLRFPSCKGITLGMWSPDGSDYVVTQGPPGGGERCIREESERGQWVEVFDTTTWESAKVIDTPMEEEAFDAPIPAFDDAGRLYIFSANEGPRIYSAGEYELIADPEGPIGALMVSPDGSLLVSVRDFRYSLNRTETGEEMDRLTGADARPNLPSGLNFSSDGRLLHGVTNGSDIYVWDVATGDQLFRLLGGDGDRGVYDPETQRLYTGHADGLVRIWNLGQPTFGRTPVGDLGSAEWVNGTPFTTGPELGMFEAIDFDGDSGYVVLFDLETGELKDERLVGHRQLALPDGRFVYQRNHSDFVFYDPATGSEQYLLGCETEDGATCVDSEEPWINYQEMYVSIEGTELAAISQPADPGTPWFDVTGVDLDTGDIVNVDRYDLDMVDFYAFGEDWIFYDNGRQGLVIDRESGEVVWESGLRVTRFNESPSRSLYSVLDFNTVHIIEAGTWHSRALPFDFGEVRGMAFNNDETRLALGDERQLTVVDLTTDQIVQRVPIEGVSDAYWIDDDTLVVGTKHGVWATISLNTDELIGDARTSLLRGFTEEECDLYRIDPCPPLDEIKGR